GADGARPRTWDDADTRASVALAPTDPQAPKGLRFADYYVDPCLDLVERHFRLARDQAEDVVQQFFCELEEPLAKGEHRGRPWKDSLRERYDPGRGSFRPYLSRVLGNFTRDWLRRQRDPVQAGPAQAPATAPALLAEHHDHEWRALLAAFRAEEGVDEASRRALDVLAATLEEGAGQAGVATRLGLAVRTVRRDLHFANELLVEWLERRLAAVLGGGGPTARALRSGLDLLPQWLHHPGPDKRVRALLFLALAWRASAPQGR
ncbi:MAG: hypothetical protein L6R48_24585, partial [Planctomycetes bacterium]|nr:hypothetical protein [Planctomycetota bacterium]